MSNHKGVMICGELAESALASITSELLGAGRKLADALGEELSAVIIGGKVSQFGDEIIKQGADKVYVIEGALFENYVNEPYVAAMEKLCKQAMPAVVLMGQTSAGRDLAPSLAFRLNTGLTTDCLELSIDPETKNMLQTKPVYGGNALSVYATESRPQIATVRPKCMSPLEPDASRKGEVVSFDPGLDPSVPRVKFVQKVKEEVEGIKLEDAEVVVCGGRGLGGPENFAALQELAKLLNGAVGATRPPCDSGWLPATSQVGLTGKLVTPTLYIGIALSGASQHLAGCSGSKNMVAINKDPDANIFKVCQYGIVGDFKKVLPPFIAKVKELVAK
ncbi:MAG: electron transfer flavoprotein subunit alpha/FixB family protein [Dehalococcoidia bacterium]|nr:electron transfer flavoprotein subunit alpha/FixB family protein [Dehalococcoidia bacterium]